MLVQIRHETRYEQVVLNQPCVQLPADLDGELVGDAERWTGGEQQVIKQHYLEVTQPLDATKVSKEIKICYT